MSGAVDYKPMSVERRAQAAQWFVDNGSGDDLNEATLTAWGEWLSDPENREAYAQVVEWHQRAVLLARPESPSDEELRADFALNSADSGRVAGVFAGFRERWTALLDVVMPRPAFGWAITVIGVAVLSFFLRAVWLTSPTGPERVYSTAHGEQADFVLGDGSLATVGGDTSFSVRFTRSERMIVLARGEGLFHVQHDKDRPFRVCAQSACVTAVGTIFDVHLYSSHVRVWVHTGTVEVRSLTSRLEGVSEGTRAHWVPVRLERGQGLSYDPHDGPGETITVDPHTAGAWTSGFLVYHGRPLTEVVEDVRRYSSRRIVLDSASAGILYSGSVLERQVDQWIRGLPQVFPVEIIDCARLQVPSTVPDATVRSECSQDQASVLIRSREFSR